MSQPDYEAATKHWERLFPCVCGPEYSERDLISPHCEHHYAEDGSREIVDAAIAAFLDPEDKDTP